jgi:predicted aminopeptidase
LVAGWRSLVALSPQWLQIVRADNVARRIRQTERREEALLALVSEHAARLDAIYSEEPEYVWQYQQTVK